MCTTALFMGCSAPDIEQQVDELFNKMTQEERIAQLRSMYMDDLFDKQGQLDTAKCRQLIPNGIGHFSQYASQKPRDPNELRDRAAAVQEWLMKNAPNGIPALLHEEVLSGVNTLGSTIYPQQIGQACSFNPELAEQGKNPLTLDSKDPTEDYQAFIRSETRYASLLKQFPETAEVLFAKNEQDAKDRLESYKKLAAE